jgi:hypothetical protein
MTGIAHGALHIGWNPISITIVFLAITTQYWLGPVLIRFKQTRPATPQGMKLAGDDSVPAALVPFVAATKRALGALGYSGFALLVQPAGVALLASDAGGSVAVGLAIPKRDGTVHSLVGFTTQLRGGRKIRTSNSPLPAIVPTPRMEDRLRLPRERDTAKLHAVHARRVAQALSAGGRIEPLSISDPVAYQQREELASSTHAVECGYWTRRGDRLGLTWKGAVLSAWRLLQPWRGLSVRRDERAAREALAA